MEKLNAIVQKIFNVAPEEINDDMSPATIDNWDSMNYLLFISEMEKEFGINFTIDEITEAKNFADIKDILKRHNVEI